MNATENLNPYYRVADIMAILHCGKNKAYQIIQKLNSELNAKGKLTMRSRVSRKYFHQHTG